MSGSDNTDAVRLFDSCTGQPLDGVIVTGHAGPVSMLRISPDGRYLATATSKGIVRFSSVDSGRPIGDPITCRHSWMNAMAFSPDGSSFATASDDRTAGLWSTDGGQPLAEPLIHDAAVKDVAFSADGLTLATASSDGTVRLWDVGTRQSIGRPLVGHSGGVPCVLFHPDGRRIISGGFDSTVRLWDIATGKPFGDPIDIPSVGSKGARKLWRMAISSDGRVLATHTYDRRVHVWPGVGSPVDLCAKLSTNMSEKQWREWISPDIPYMTVCPGLPIPADEPDDG